MLSQRESAPTPTHAVQLVVEDTPSLALIGSDVVVGSLSGELDMSNVAETQALILGAVPLGALGFVLDLSAVTHVDSSGVRLLFEVGERLKQRGAAFRLVAPSRAPLRRLLSITRLDTLVPVDESVAAAEKTIRATSGPGPG